MRSSRPFIVGFILAILIVSMCSTLKLGVAEIAKEYKFEYWLPWSDNTWPSGSDDLESLVRFVVVEDDTIIQIDSDHDGVVDAQLKGNAGDQLGWGYDTEWGTPKPGYDVLPPIGTVIRSNKPVSAFYWHSTNDWGIYDDHYYFYGLIPALLLGNDYYVWTESTVASILSTSENNRVFIDEDNDEYPEQSFTLGYGEHYIYSNTKVGAHIYADKPIAVVVVNWDSSYDTETYAYELYPTSMLSSEYSCPHPNPGIQYYEYATNKCRVVIGAIQDDTRVNVDENNDGVPEISQNLVKGQHYVYMNPKPGARIYGNKEFYALYVFDVYARDPWAGVYRDYMYAFIIPPKSLSGKTFLMLDRYELYHVVFSSVNIFILEDGTEIYVDRGFDGTIDETYQGNKGDVINIVGKLRFNITKITTNKPVTAVYSWEGGWVGVSEATAGFTLIPLDLLLPKVRAEIVSYLISSGEFKVGDQVSAQVTVKNLGEEAWTFYVGFSVQDPNGKWWDAPYKAITLNPNEEGTVTLYWTVPSEAPAGYYDARVAVWGGKEDDKLINPLDYSEEYGIFRVIKEYVLKVKPNKYHYIFDSAYLITQYYILDLVGELTDSYGNPIPNAEIDVIDSLKGACSFIKTDGCGSFRYSVYANKIGKFNFIFSFQNVRIDVTLIVYKHLKKIACIMATFPDKVPSEDWEHEKNMVLSKFNLIQRYYLEQSYFSVFLTFELVNPADWIVLDKTFGEYGSPTAEESNKWQMVRDDAIRKAMNEIGFDESAFDSTIVAMDWESSGPCDLRAFATPDGRIILHVYNSYGIWAHELGHALFKFNDCYSGDLLFEVGKFLGRIYPGLGPTGDLGYWCLMGAGSIMDPPSTISSINKAWAGWLEYNDVGYGTYSVTLVEDQTYGGEVLCYNDFPYVFYIIEGRHPPDNVRAETEKSGYFYLKEDKGVVLYKMDELFRFYVIPHGGNDYLTATLLPGEHYDDAFGGVGFSLYERDGQLYINIYRRTILDAIVVAIQNVKIEWPSSSILFEPEQSSLIPDVDLKYYTYDGKFVGMNYTSGKYEIQVEGALASGNIPGCGPEWILVPSGTNGYFVVDPTPLNEFLRAKNITIEHITITWQVAYYDSAGNRFLSDLINTTISTANLSILSIPATIDLDPDVLNVKSNGKWLTCYIELPREYNLSDIDLSSISINGTVYAEEFPYGITDYDEDGILELMVKFDRASVISLIQIEENCKFQVTLTVAGHLKNGIPFFGSYVLTIIMKIGKN